MNAGGVLVSVKAEAKSDVRFAEQVRVKAEVRKEKMAVKQELEAPCVEQGIVIEKKPDLGREDAQMTPLRPSPRVLECWMAPVKPERSYLRRHVKDEKVGIIFVKESAEKPKKGMEVDDYDSFVDSPLRFGPKFGEMSDTDDDECNEAVKSKEGMLVSECDRFLDSPLRFCPEFDVFSDYADDVCKTRFKTKTDRAGGKLGKDFEDEKDIISVIGSKYGVINTRCPLSGKLVTELAEPVESVSCRHVYDRAAAETYINQYAGVRRCAVAGCSKSLIQQDLVCDMSLRESIQDLRQKDLTAEVNLMMECIRIDDD